MHTRVLLCILMQEVNGWCEENTYDKLRKMLTTKIKLLAEKGVTGV